jgi:RimJ/RimL family protein N-acetyltransferase
MTGTPIIVPYYPAHAYEVLQRNVREQDLWLSDYPEWDQWVQGWKDGGPAYTLIMDDQVVGCAGVVLLEWGRGEAWTLLSSLFYRYKLTAIRFIKKYLQRIAEDEELKRVQAQVRCDFEAGKRFIEFLGFEREGVLRRFGPNSEDIVMYSKLY